ncbi:FAD-dependent oxidoreductase [Streptomyces albus]|uniref:FAD-dependent oxidoreductase n=1 Tax=Streptomyces albus (strain ATCC 21838 / DSM 41398 / FERM P-419 / JCM 4703 / NBRC 107858) TaxID=1081613 RepID=A0A0B5EM73_STRA4|nr:FAD-dependent oxidoreductase [Streptomyces albus]AOU74765.1 FAD-dependent oxidoreductase [Streptomyces albus]
MVGASLAGLRAVEGARKAGFDGTLTLIGAERHLPYDRPPLSKAFLDDHPAEAVVETTAFRTEQALRHDLGVDLRLGTPATGLDTRRKEVLIGDEAVPYDAAVIATGAHARTLPTPPGLAGVHTLRTVDDAIAVRAALDAGARTVVIGAGFIGSEVASSARKRGLEVTVLEALPTPLVRAVGEALGEVCGGLHRRHGTDLRCGVGVRSLEGHERVERVVLSDGSTLPADLVVLGVGAVPATDWLAGSGITLEDGIVCDSHLFTGAEGVYAAGDVARWHNPVFDRPMRLEHWTSAAEQGSLAARNALDPTASTAYVTVPYFWSDWYDQRIQFVGSPQADETLVLEDDTERDGRCVALYREGDRLIGALSINGQSLIMKLRALIRKRATWADALAFAEQRRIGGPSTLSR